MRAHQEGHDCRRDPEPELDQLYADFTAENLNPLWTRLGDLMPMTPTSKAVAFVWK